MGSLSSKAVSQKDKKTVMKVEKWRCNEDLTLFCCTRPLKSSAQARARSSPRVAKHVGMAVPTTHLISCLTIRYGILDCAHNP